MMALCELVRGYKTSDETLAAARAFAEAVGKTCVVVNRDVAGFVTTRLICALAMEAVRLVESGVASAEDIDTACRLGFGHAMGPLATTDLTGVDILRNATHEHLRRDRRREVLPARAADPDGRRRRPRPQVRARLLPLRRLTDADPLSHTSHTRHSVAASTRKSRLYRQVHASGRAGRMSGSIGPDRQPETSLVRLQWARGWPEWSSSVSPGYELALSGRLDVSSVEDVRAALHRPSTRATGDLVVDLLRVELVDATGLGRAARRRTAGPSSRAGRLVLRDAQPAVLRILRVTRLHRVLTLEPAVVGPSRRRRLS